MKRKLRCAAVGLRGPALALCLAACAAPGPSPDPAASSPAAPEPALEPPPAVPVAPVSPAKNAPAASPTAFDWVQHAAEYRALSRQVYAGATRLLPRALRDPKWSALASQDGSATSLPPAVILDIDETVLDNSGFQLELGDRPYDPALWDRWIARREAPALPGAAEFIEAARAAGVSVFLVTNRRCRSRDGEPAACPQQQDTLANLAAEGIASDPAQLLLRDEEAAWTSEKRVRRELIGASHRVLMLFGDDLADFLPCVRATAVPPCDSGATAAERKRLVAQYGDYWGTRWFVLPNPMYGSWVPLR